MEFLHLYFLKNLKFLEPRQDISLNTVIVSTELDIVWI